MQLANFLLVSPFLTACSAATLTIRASAYNDVNLYAYGTNISGVTVKYGKSDGLAYITANSSTEYLPLTWDITRYATESWNATVNNSTTATFYIETSGYESAGFLASNSTSNSSVLTVGFILFGTQVFFKNGTSLESGFWAETTSEDGIWALKWNYDGTAQENSVPLALKTTSPSS